MTKIFGFIALVLVLGGCSIAEQPFIYINPVVTVTKDLDYIHRTGFVSVCYNDEDFEKARALAFAACRQYGLEGVERLIQHNQCKISAPSKITIRCYDPKMRFANGYWVNALNQIEVQAWRLEQVKLTGKPIDEIYAGPVRDIPDIDSLEQP